MNEVKTMKHKLKIQTLNIDHWFESIQDMEKCRRVILNSKGNQQVLSTKTMEASPCPSYFPDLMTEEQLIHFLQIPEVSTAKDFHNVVKNLIRMRNLPRIQIGRKLLFPKKAVLEWIEENTIKI